MMYASAPRTGFSWFMEGSVSLSETPRFRTTLAADQRIPTNVHSNDLDDLWSSDLAFLESADRSLPSALVPMRVVA
jgi:hypothetical protein